VHDNDHVGELWAVSIEPSSLFNLVVIHDTRIAMIGRLGNTLQICFYAKCMARGSLSVRFQKRETKVK